MAGSWLQSEIHAIILFFEGVQNELAHESNLKEAGLNKKASEQLSGNK